MLVLSAFWVDCRKIFEQNRENHAYRVVFYNRDSNRFSCTRHKFARDGRPFFENASEALLPKSGAIAMTVIGGVCAMITFFLTFFSFVVPAMAKFAPKINGVLLDANKDNIRTVVRTIGEASKTSSQSAPVQEDVETMFCHNCGQKIAKDSVYCKHCGAKQ